ncbi:hypothetical protein IAE35_04090 [Pseudomonas sp. S75]|uniref:hypothetical protein n=1 Tax=unclassified Pseudomonas TaxID=196821 RepID=UPI00190627F9|nr:MULTISPECIES: hypothetical protein [unclassified Pseudomonas]MBJ9974735.1 hypothetical protein [Pseudomonas sp. S30]MBK0152509.1 hypothetical protein [Pseudomonas sp. S75]
MTYDDHGLMLIGHSALLMPPDLDPRQRADALDSLHYCQLVATKQAGERFAHEDAWAMAYRQGFASLRWLRLSSAHESTTGASVEGAAARPLAEWTTQRHLDFDGLLSTISQRLLDRPEALDQLLTFAVHDQGSTHALSVEFGLLGAGPTLDLCSISTHSPQPIDRTALIAALRRTLPATALTLRALSLKLDGALFAAQRDELHALVAQKERDKPRRLAVEGGRHE